MKVEFTDSELRALLLNRFYGQRRESTFDEENPGSLMPDGSVSEFHRVVDQLVDVGLVQAETLLIPTDHGYDKNYRGIKITTAGISAVERGVSEKIKLDFTVVQHITNINQPLGPVHVGDSVTITNALNLLVEKIDQSSGTDDQKREAKSLIQRVLEHPLTSAVVGAAATALMD